MKKLAALLASALALSACSSLTGPDADEAARAALARRQLEAASKVDRPSMKLAAN